MVFKLHKPKQDSVSPRSGQPLKPYAARLKNDEIRLFMLQLDNTDVLSISLVPYKWEAAKKLQYTAISYVCGDGGDLHEIFVNSQPFRIKKNLFNVLLDLKRSYRNSVVAYKDQSTPTGPRMTPMLWADAICINQKDLVEKAQKVREMHYIYKHARRVHIFAGASTDHFDCMALVCLWLQSHEQERPHRPHNADESLDSSHKTTIIPKLGLEERLLRSYNIDEKNLTALLTSIDLWHDGDAFGDSFDFTRSLDHKHHIPWDHPFWLTCIDFFELEYFSRLWTCQEFWLARPGESQFRIGNYDIRFEPLSNLFFCLVRKEEVFTKATVWKEMTVRLNRFRLRQMELSLMWRHRLQETSIWGLFALSSQRLATEVQDHVYALLGSIPQEARQRILVDYQIPHAQVFADAIAVGIEQGGSLRGLIFLWEQLSRIPPRTKGLPSWCPDLANKNREDFGAFSEMLLPDFSAFAKISTCHPRESTRLRVAVTKAVARHTRLSVFTKLLTRRHVVGVRLRVGIVDTVAQCLVTPFPAWKNFQASIGDHGSTRALMDLIHCILELQAMFSKPEEGTADPNHFGLGSARLEAFLDLIIQRGTLTLGSSRTGRSDSPTLDTERNQDPTASADFDADHQINIRVASSICSMLLETPDDDITMDEAADRSRINIEVFDETQLPLGVLVTDSPSARLNLVKNAVNFIERLSRQLQGTYIFKTSKGDIGHSPRRLHPGDNICIVPGGEYLLHVLSADKSRYVSSAAGCIPFDEDKWAGLSHEEQESFFEEVTLH